MPILEGWLLYTKEDYRRNKAFAERFLNFGNNSKSRIRLIFKDDLIYGIKNNTYWLSYKDLEISPPDFVINRSIDYMMSRHLEYMGARVFNSSKVSEICNDKARTYQEIARLSIPVVDTIFADKNMILNDMLKISFPVVVKSADGRGGKEVFLVRSAKELVGVAENTGKNKFVIQKVCGCPGKDVRVYVVGRKIVGAVIRRSKTGFKANISLGGVPEFYHLNENEIKTVMKITDQFNFGMVGIDFIFDENMGFLFNEIEDVAGSRSLYMTSNIDIAKIYLEHIYNEAEGWD
jgi:gamma-F420-2:alpha-L-glutamate ligase